MSDQYETEITFLEPQYVERSNRGRDPRITLRQIEVSMLVKNTSSRHGRYNYTLTFRPDDAGNVSLSTVDRDSDNHGVGINTFARALTKAEDAVGQWCAREDNQHLTLTPFTDVIERVATSGEVESAPPITTEAAASEGESA